MTLPIPNLDDRGYQDILKEALARVRVHTPEWTNLKDSDPGVTVTQLFAFMTESLLYRSNLIPERNRRKFLDLLGLPMQPPQAAQGLASFSNDRGPLAPVLLQPGQELLAGKVPFLTLDGLEILPVEMQAFYKQPLGEAKAEQVRETYERLYESFGSKGTGFAFYETKALEAPLSGSPAPAVELSRTVDRSLWLALLSRHKDRLAETRSALSRRVLTLGILPMMGTDGLAMRPGNREDAITPALSIVFEMPKVVSGAAIEPATAAYTRLEARPTGDILQEGGVVQISLPGEEGLATWVDVDPLEQGVGNFPPALDDARLQERLITWIRIRLPAEASAPADSRSLASAGSPTAAGAKAALTWVGVNATRVRQGMRVQSELLGKGNGEAGQSFRLANRPVIPASLRIKVGGEPWLPIDDLAAAAPEVPSIPVLAGGAAAGMPSGQTGSKVFRLDPAAGEIHFGDGLHGTRPPPGASVHAAYEYGGGRQGIVGIGAINKAAALPPGIKVSNPVPAWGGDEAETVAQAERRISRFLQHRDRLVTVFDYKEITWRTPGVDLGRVEILPLTLPDMPDIPMPGAISVLVIPKYDPLDPDYPMPDRPFLETVSRHLAPRRLITTEVHVRAPVYVPLWTTLGIEALPGQSIALVLEEVKRAVRTFFSPLQGGFGESGWPLGKDVEELEIRTIATRVQGVSKITGVYLAEGNGQAMARVPLRGMQLPRLLGIAVGAGDPPEIDSLRGDALAPEIARQLPVVLPIPVAPEGC